MTPPPLRRGPRGALLRGAALLVALALGACATTRAPALKRSEPQRLEPQQPEPQSPAGPPLTVQLVDIGQGDGIIILSPTGKSILLDAGDRGRHRQMLAQLAEDGVTALDLAIMSHAHADHIGGMQRTLERVPARIFLDPGLDYPSGIYARLLEYLASSKTKVVIARRGRRIDIGGGASLLILAPSDPLLVGTRSDANSNSVVFKLSYGDTSMLFTGDSEAETERRVLEADETLAADVLKVAHHGSAYATTQGFLDAVRPKIAVISCGVDNKYGHPAPSTVERLERAGVEVWRTDLNGTITLVSDGRRWTVSAERGGPEVAEVAKGGEREDRLAPQRPRPPPVLPLATQMAPCAPLVATPQPGAALTGEAGEDAGEDDKLDINRATAAQLRAIRGIGPAKAAAIVAYIAEVGPLTSLDVLTQVSGVGGKTLARIAERFAVFPPAEPAEPEPHEAPE